MLNNVTARDRAGQFAAAGRPAPDFGWREQVTPPGRGTPKRRKEQCSIV